MADEAVPNTPGKATNGALALSVREAEILTKAWMCLKSGPPEIDYEKLAGECGMTNPRSAGNAWSAIKKKMGWGAAAATPGPSATKSRASKRKKTPALGPAAGVEEGDAAQNNAENEDAEVNPTPTKKARKKPAGGSVRKTPKAPMDVAMAEVDEIIKRDQELIKARRANKEEHAESLALMADEV
ncbi:hypothetical protein BD289DRAFT_501498 [Coniella lustricola]|uniref:Uncharacterized protein n=1 Tax=Coniella lustricola TaxID=2025994 RepID=A0A2T3A506_9PEZI|nr:hypothetical protein BD289DRAFT_501498 [Coniella lustricola]